MTRNDFLYSVESWCDLLEFCNDERCSVCDDVYNGYSVNEYIDESLMDRARRLSWTDLRDELDNIPSICEDCYYTSDTYYEWRELDDYSDFQDYKDEVLSWGDDRDIWDEEDEEEEEEPEEEPEFDDVSIDDLISIGTEIDLSVSVKKEEEIEFSFEDLFATVII